MTFTKPVWNVVMRLEEKAEQAEEMINEIAQLSSVLLDEFYYYLVQGEQQAVRAAITILRKQKKRIAELEMQVSARKTTTLRYAVAQCPTCGTKLDAEGKAVAP